MTREEFDEMSLYDLIDIAENEGIDIQSRDVLKDFVKYQIDEDNMFLAVHVLQALADDDAEFFVYDFGMGTLEEPDAIWDKDDLIEYFESQDLIEESVRRPRRRISKESIRRNRRK